MNQFQQAVEFYQASLSIFEQIDNSEWQIKVLGSMKRIHIELKQYQDADTANWLNLKLTQTSCPLPSALPEGQIKAIAQICINSSMVRAAEQLKSIVTLYTS